MRLGLQPDTHVFDRPAEDGVCETGEGAREVVLGIAEWLGGMEGFERGGGGRDGVVAGFEETTREVETAELDGNLPDISLSRYLEKITGVDIGVHRLQYRLKVLMCPCRMLLGLHFSRSWLRSRVRCCIVWSFVIGP